MDCMANIPCAVVPYHDPYDHDVPDVLNFINDSSDPTLEALLDEGAVPSSPHQPLPLLDNEIQDFPISPIWDLLGNEGTNFISLADHPSQFSGGGGQSSFDQNLGLGFGNDVMPLPIWAPPPPNPFSCCGCQVLREIVHFNRKSSQFLD